MACSEAPEVIAEGSMVTVRGVSDSSLFRVSIAGDTTRILGRYTAIRGGMQFRPAFPFDSGRHYEVVVNRAGQSPIVSPFRFPATARVPSTRVTRIYPGSDTLPENLLRLYVEFSAPMSRESGLPYVKLLDAGDREVRQAFLPLDASFWDHDFRRFTLFLDPGRVKRGILPNEQMGRALVAGRGYTIVVDSTWTDGRGQPLVAPFTKRFTARVADYRPIVLDRWRLEQPLVGGRAPVTIHFDRPLDHGLLNRAIGVEEASGPAIDGAIEIAEGERSIRFTPSEPWKDRAYHLVVLDILEDVAGNRVNRPFEVDAFDRADSSAVPAKHTIPFRPRSR